MSLFKIPVTFMGLIHPGLGGYSVFTSLSLGLGLPRKHPTRHQQTC
jgi:hypothetical protein